MDNINWVDKITISTDTQALGGRIRFYNHNGQSINNMDKEEFINLSGNPIIESYKNSSLEDLSKGKSLVEAFNDIHPGHINNHIELLQKEYYRKYFS